MRADVCAAQAWLIATPPHVKHLLLSHIDCPADAVVDEPGLDIILDPTGELERCLTTALTEAELKKLANFAPVTDAHDKQAIKELCAVWDMDHMPHGMSQVGLCLCCLGWPYACVILCRVLKCMITCCMACHRWAIVSDAWIAMCLGSAWNSGHAYVVIG